MTDETPTLDSLSRSDLIALWQCSTPSARAHLEALLEAQLQAQAQAKAAKAALPRRRTDRADAPLPGLPADAGDFEAWLPEVSPAYRWDWPHIRYLCGKIRAWRRGELTRHIAISIPPRHGKTELVTVRLPAFEIEHDHRWRVIQAAYNQRHANRYSRKTRKIVAARVELNPALAGVAEWETMAGGGVIAVGVGTGIAGVGMNRGLLDDPIKSRRDANSATYRAGLWEWMIDDYMTRLEPGAGVCAIMTRWHWDDPIGRIQRSDDAHNWTIINLPALAEENDPLGRAPGAALCPERYPAAELLRLKAIMGHSFDGLFQGRPAPQEGAVLDLSWFRRYEAITGEPVMIVQSWDTAQKGAEHNSFSVCTTWAVTRLAIYLVHVYRERLAFPALDRMARSLAEKFHPDAVLIEDKGSGQSLIQVLREETALPVIPIEPEGDKVTRAMEQSLPVQAGLVHLPTSAPWLPDLETEIREFPLGADKDQIDSLTQALRWIRSQPLALAWEALGVPRAGVEAWEISGGTGGRARLDTETGFGRLRGSHDTRGF